MTAVIRTEPNTSSATERPSRPAAKRPSRPAAEPRRRGPGWWHHAGTALLILVVALILIPFGFTVLTAFRPGADVAANPLALPTRLTVDNFVAAMGQINYVPSVINSVVILAFSLVITILLGSLASYPLARITRSWSRTAYRVFIAGTTIPVFVLIAPLYLLQRDLGILNTHFGVILAYGALNLPIAIFFYTSFFRQIPIELEEAAALDGAGPLRIFFTVLFPLLRPITATLATFLTLAVWNDLLVPLVFLRDPELRTVMVNAYALVGTFTTDPTVLFPAALLGAAPLLIVFIVFQRHVVAGLTMGAVKS